MITHGESVCLHKSNSSFMKEVIFWHMLTAHTYGVKAALIAASSCAERTYLIQVELNSSCGKLLKSVCYP